MKCIPVKSARVFHCFQRRSYTLLWGKVKLYFNITALFRKWITITFLPLTCINLFTSEWVTNLHILTPNNSRFYGSRIHNLKWPLKLTLLNSGFYVTWRAHIQITSLEIKYIFFLTTLFSIIRGMKNSVSAESNWTSCAGAGRKITGCTRVARQMRGNQKYGEETRPSQKGYCWSKGGGERAPECPRWWPTRRKPTTAAVTAAAREKQQPRQHP